MPIGPPVPELRLLQTWTLKLQGQGHGCGQWARLCSQPTSFSLHINQNNNSWDTAILKFDLEKSKVKVMGEVKGQGPIVHPVSNWCNYFLFHFTRTNHSSDMANSVWSSQNTSKFFFKFAKKVPTKISPKSRQVINMTGWIKLWSFVVIRWVVLTLLCRQTNFSYSMP